MPEARAAAVKIGLKMCDRSAARQAAPVWVSTGADTLLCADDINTFILFLTSTLLNVSSTSASIAGVGVCCVGPVARVKSALPGVHSQHNRGRAGEAYCGRPNQPVRGVPAHRAHTELNQFWDLLALQGAATALTECTQACFLRLLRGSGQGRATCCSTLRRG